MDSLISEFWDAGQFMPHGMCYLWQPGILTLHVASDALIAAAYFSIPFTLTYFVRKRKDLEFNLIIACFAIFIVACGTTHLMEIVTIWHPAYWLSGAVKAVTAAASVPTALLLMKLMPQALRWPSPMALRNANDRLQIANSRLVTEAAERRRAQEEVQRINQELQEARDAADRANRAKGRFLATASHDLRQPVQTLTLLNGFLRRLAANPEVIDTVAEQEMAVAAMARLLNAILDISKLESGAITPQIRDFDLASSFKELRIEFSELAQKKGLLLEVPQESIVARSDPTLLGQILQNLISNAIRYTSRGVVRVRVAREAEWLRIDVEDSGVGISQDEMALIFDEFYQSGVAPYTVRDGHGLGLSIVRRAAELLNHELRVRSELGRGSTFSISVPAGSTSSVAQIPAEPVPATASARRAPVLIVDDHPAVLKATERVLKVEGFGVSTASSLQEAMAVASRERDIELLVTDFHLGNGEVGTDVIAAVRRVLGRRLRAVVISGDTSSAVKGAIHDDRIWLVSKPIQSKELVTLLVTLLESRTEGIEEHA